MSTTTDIQNDGRPGLRRLNRKQLVTVAVTVAILAAALGTALVKREQRARAQSRVPTFTVERGPLTISITESGTVESKEKVIVKARAEGRNTVIWVVEEGTEAKKGDLLVELDASRFEQTRVEQEIQVQNSEASFIRATETLEVVKNQATADTARAELDLRFARLALKKYKQGEYPQQQQTAEAEITLAREEVTRAQEKVEWSALLATNGYITLSEFQADKLALKRSEIDLELAQSRLNLLEQYTHGQTLEQLESDVTQAEMALERVRRKATADVIQAEADLRARTSEHVQQTNKLVNVMEQLAYCRIVAPADGMVVYATSGGNRWRGSSGEPLASGQEVVERQDLIHLPTTSDMVAQIRIQESSLTKVQTGMTVRVRADALPGRMFEGRLTKIGVLPDATRAWLNPDLKVYNCSVELQSDTSGMRPGMSCRAEVIVEEHDDVLFVPVQSVLRVHGEPTVYVLTRRGSQPREVSIGLDNNRMVHVLAGVEPGEKVLLAPPLPPSTLEREKPDDSVDLPELPPTAPPTDEQDRRETSAPGEPGKISPPGTRAPGGENRGGGDRRGRQPR